MPHFSSSTRCGPSTSDYRYYRGCSRLRAACIRRRRRDQRRCIAWLVFITFVLALFLVLARRRHELIALGDDAIAHRSALSEYSVRLVDQMIAIVAGATLVSYMIYTASAEVEAKLGTRHLYLTVPFVAFEILRYLYLIDERNEGGDPARALMHDRPLLVAVALWILTDIALLYF